MSFNVKSEKFSTVIECPDGTAYSIWKLVIYDGNIALVDETDFENVVNDPDGARVLQIFVLDETAQKWRETCIKIHRWEQKVGDRELYFKGTIGTRELVFAPADWLEGQNFVVYYNPATRELRRFEIEGMVDGYFDVQTYLDHVESTWLIEE
ncbi:PREDICTED: putative F-box protein At1g70970 [Camelina sativa]|uniref:F-box protein At1g70970 n=1 Tax=Camelina sativa TaxID=90675 RepID=A0ABM0V6C3_CAMSA|nr:PREDICTED: putative F-box protein At1g70970 [Camelina sativa]